LIERSHFPSWNSLRHEERLCLLLKAGHSLFYCEIVSTCSAPSLEEMRVTRVLLKVATKDQNTGSSPHTPGNERIVKHRIDLLNLAEELSNLSKGLQNNGPFPFPLPFKRPEKPPISCRRWAPLFPLQFFHSHKSLMLELL